MPLCMSLGISPTNTDTSQPFLNVLNHGNTWTTYLQSGPWSPTTEETGVVLDSNGWPVAASALSTFTAKVDQAVVTASVTGSVMTVTAVTSGTLVLGGHVTGNDGSNALDGYIASFGTGAGGTGTYNIS